MQRTVLPSGQLEDGHSVLAVWALVPIATSMAELVEGFALGDNRGGVRVPMGGGVHDPNRSRWRHGCQGMCRQVCPPQMFDTFDWVIPKSAPTFP